MKRTVLRLGIMVVMAACSVSSLAATVRIPMYQVTDQKSVGAVIASDSPYGLLLTPELHDLTPGIHGFHIHQNPMCADHGDAAGGHLDPQQTGKHLGPYAKEGHLGDLPVLIVNDKGMANLPILAPRLTVADLSGHALMIHAGADNYADTPEKLGGGGARIACGAIQ